MTDNYVYETLITCQECGKQWVKVEEVENKKGANTILVHNTAYLYCEDCWKSVIKRLKERKGIQDE